MTLERTFGRKAAILAIAAFALFGSAAAAFAAPAVANANVNVRSGPGTGYRVVDVLQRGQRVDIQNCRGNWCLVEKPGRNGWVSANYLSEIRPSRPSRPDRWDRPGRPDWGWNRPGRPGGWYPAPPRPPRPGSNANVCFNGPNGYFCFGQ